MSAVHEDKSQSCLLHDCLCRGHTLARPGGAARDQAAIGAGGGLRDELRGAATRTRRHGSDEEARARWAEESRQVVLSRSKVLILLGDDEQQLSYDDLNARGQKILGKRMLEYAQKCGPNVAVRMAMEVH